MVFGETNKVTVVKTDGFLPGTERFGENTENGLRLSSHVLSGGYAYTGGDQYPLTANDLVAHEFAHNITREMVAQGISFYDSGITVNGRPVDYPRGFGVRAGNHTDYSENCGQDCERTADAIASWFLNDFDDLSEPVATARAEDVNIYMMDLFVKLGLLEN